MRRSLIPAERLISIQAAPAATIRTTRACVKCGELFTLTALRVQEALDGHHMICGNCKRTPTPAKIQEATDGAEVQA